MPSAHKKSRASANGQPQKAPEPSTQTHTAPPSPPPSPEDRRNALPTGTGGAAQSQQDVEQEQTPPTRDNATLYDPAVAEATSDLAERLLATLKASGEIFDALGAQLATVTSLGPTSTAIGQIEMTQRELEARRGGQEAELQAFEERLLDSTLRSAIQAVLQPVINEMVSRIVHQEVEHRVKEEVRNQMSKRHPNIREELALCQRRIAEAKIALHNGEARRYNHFIKSDQLHAPLRPLLLPLPPHQPAPPEATPGSGGGSTTGATVGSGSGGSTSEKSLGKKASKLSVVTDPAGLRAASASSMGGGAGGGSPTGVSPLFPQSVAELVSLSQADVRTLVKEYALKRNDGEKKREQVEDEAAKGRKADGKRSSPATAKGTGKKLPPTPVNNAGSAANGSRDPVAARSREQYLNRFMKHVGLTFEFSPAGEGGGVSRLLEQPHGVLAS